MNSDQPESESIAIIGMAGRFPNARNVREYWRNLCEGRECVSFFTDEELRAAGADPGTGDASYIKARAILDEAEWFDAAFFGINPKEADVMDPQHRVFLECAWEALEDAGYEPEAYKGSVGVFAGMSPNSYLTANLMTRPDVMGLVGQIPVNLGNDKDYLPLRVSYKLNLRGPSLNVQTTCSTTLMTAALACQQLLTYQCDIALAGGVCISFPQKRGHKYQEGGIFSEDGHCRAFDEAAMGTVSGEGVGIVVLKRLSDAIEDGDQIYAVIKGFAVNNDGSQKIGFTAPSVEGQAGVIATAQAMAGVSPESISYIEAHGTGTPLGDPIELEALCKAFRMHTDARQFCAIGSVKTNIGHLDVAAGVAGLIKVALALRHQKIPASLHYQSPNPKIDFANSPFYVNTTLADWKRGDAPRRAGISSFGFGGTNVHLILEESPALPANQPAREAQLLTLSAHSESALDQATTNLVNHLRENPQIELADVAGTLQRGRRAFSHRRALVCDDVESAVEALVARDPRRVMTRVFAGGQAPVVFMFPGQGAQEVNMGQTLYLKEPEFRRQVDQCAEILRPILGCDLRSVLYPQPEGMEEARVQLNQTRFAQPALFVIEHALARLWQKWGVQPGALIGHSVGEYVGACLAGVFPVEEAVKLVAARAQLVQGLPGGSMLAVRLTERDVEPLLNGTFALAAVNAPSLCVISGPTVEVQELQARLTGRGIASRLLATSHAFHSAMMDPVIRPFADLVRKARPQEPRMRVASTVTGTWLTPQQATDPAYWAGHLRQTVRFTEALKTVLQEAPGILLESGPGQTLGTLARQHPDRKENTHVLTSLHRSREGDSDHTAICQSLGQLWLHGVPVDWSGFQAAEKYRRVSLPTYPFERKRHWVEPGATATPALSQTVPACQAGANETSPTTPVRESSPIVETEPGSSANTLGIIRRLFASLSGLDLSRAPEQTTFLELGFDSLFMVQASNALEKQFAVKVAFRDLMGSLSSLRALADHLDSMRAPELNPLPAPVQVAPVSSTAESHNDGAPAVEVITAPLTPAQREIWFACQISDGASCAYNESRILHFHGALSLERLANAVQRLVDRHEALRTTVHAGGEFQQVHRSLRVDLPCQELVGIPAAQQDEQLAAMEAGEALQPFDLVGGPLFRVRLVRLAPDHHALFLTVHHIVCDGGGWVILLEELGRLYSSEESLPPNPLQLSEYAALQTQRAQSEEWTACEEYWVREYADGAPVLELPTDGIRPATWKFDGARESVVLGRELSQEVKRIGAHHGCTLFTTLLAAWSALLSRLSNQDDLVVGVPVADRVMERSETLVGHCVNFLPVRLRIPDSGSFADYLGQVRQRFFEAFDHRFLAFGNLVQRLSVQRDSGRMPLVSVTFNVDRLESSLSFTGVEVRIENNRCSSANFDLSFNVTDANGELHLDCRYNRSMFTAQTIRRWLRHFETLLQSITADARQAVAGIPLLSAEEQQQILTDWNETTASFSGDKCLHQLFEDQAGRTPAAVAAEFQGSSLTYAELNDRANRLAHRLQALSVGPDVPVGLCLDRSLDLPVAVLAVMKAGGVCVPLDPAYPMERRSLMFNNVRAAVLLSQMAHQEHWQFEGQSVPTLWVDAPESWDGADKAPETGHVESSVSSRNLAYIIHTSGSTGVPKGVAMEHRPLVNLVEWQAKRSRMGEGSRTLQFASLNFDVSFQELFSTWATGGTLVMMEDSLRQDAAGLRRWLRDKHVNRLFLPFVALRQLAEVVSAGGALPEDLREVITAGEALQITPAIASMFQRLKNCTLDNQYGPSESHVVTAFALSGPPADWPALPPIGRPVANARVYVVDGHGQPVPPGVPGELIVGGACLARGYLHQPELTAERFFSDPFVTDPTARLYRTGDVVRWQANGTLEYVGRSDQQVKIRGHRVEPGDVESALSRHPAVKASVVVARDDSAGGKKLIAFVVNDPDQAAVSAADLRAFLLHLLPEALVPSTISLVDNLPLTPSGKVDRRALPTPESAPLEMTSAFPTPRTPTEEALAAIWCDVLDLKAVGMRDNFFDVGGHSLLMTRVLLRAGEAFQVELPLRRFFESPTIEGLAAAIEELVIEQIQQSSPDATGQSCAQIIS